MWASGSALGASARIAATSTAGYEDDHQVKYGKSRSAAARARCRSNANLSGLTPAKTYYYRVTATNSNGTVTGSQGTFTTPARAPITGVTAATGLSTSTATLNGTVDPGGASADWQFDYGIGAYDQTATGTTLTGTTSQNVEQVADRTAARHGLPVPPGGNELRGHATSTGTFTTDIAAPTAVTGGASAITARGATAAGR